MPGEELFAFLKGAFGLVWSTHRAAYALPIHLTDRELRERQRRQGSGETGNWGTGERTVGQSFSRAVGKTKSKTGFRL